VDGPRPRNRRQAPTIAIVLAVVATLAALGLAGPSAAPSSAGPSNGPAVSRLASESAGASASPVAVSSIPVLAYYYMWFNAISWTHTKTDLPTLGGYNSTDPAVIKQQVTWARESGVDALIASWKSTPSLNLALSELIAECDRQGLKLVIIYQGLDVNRNPIPTATVAADLLSFEQQYESDPAFQLFGRPAVIWSGSWRFSNADIAYVRGLVGAPGKLLLLGSERSAADYTPRAGLFDGDAYYWSSADPLTTPGYQKRLIQLSAAVHAGHGLWLAPAAVGFDARLNGGTSIVDRRDGATLTAAWADALATSPDGVALISWNEYTENSYVEPSQNYGDRYLRVLSLLTGGTGPLDALSPAASASADLPTTSPSPTDAGPAETSAAAGAIDGSRRGSGGAVPARYDLTDLLVAGLILGLLGLLGLRLRRRFAVESSFRFDGQGPGAGRGPVGGGTDQ
jgi:hypothetical protein